MNAKHTENNGKQAIIWGRYSADKQKDGDSRDRQERLNRALAKREGIKVLAEYFDEATSVKDGPTPLFRKVVASLPAGVGIIAENLDRISRGHPWKSRAYVAEIVEAGHWIITSTDGNEYTAESIKEPSRVSAGDMQTSTAYAGNYYRIQRVNEAKDETIDKARKGIPAPLGAWLPAHVKYNFDTTSYVINEPIKATTRHI